MGCSSLKSKTQQIPKRVISNMKNRHIVLIHEKKNVANDLEFEFIKSGLKRNENCVYIHQNPSMIKTKMAKFGIDVKKFDKKGLLKFIKIPKKFTDYSKLIDSELKKLKQLENNLCLVSTHKLDFDESSKTNRMCAIEQKVDDNFNHKTTSMICSFHVADVEGSLQKQFFHKLLESHETVIFVTKSGTVFEFSLP